jgi:uncharacterized protein (TIGR02231 family)
MSKRFHAPAACAALLAASAVHAQDATRIVAATVYPDSARVERELRVPGGARHVTLACLPASVDVATLQVDGDAALRLGELRVTPLPASRAAECAPSATEARHEALALRRASLEAQRDANELALAYLRTWGSAAPPPPAGQAGKAAPAARPGAQAGDLRQAALDLLVDQAKVRHELEDLARESDRVADAAPAVRGKSGWRTLRFDVWTPAAAALRVRYNVSGTWWRPSYRAAMDGAHGTLRLDRQAELVQASGEDWGEVRVTLSTGRVNRVAQAPLPAPWFLDLAIAAPSFSAAAPAPAPRVVMTGTMEARVDADTLRRTVADKPPAPPDWGVSAATAGQATEFVVAQPVTLASDGETHTLQLSSQVLPATLKRRTAPRSDRAVYLLAQAERPDGVWPAGPLQAWLDGTLVARSAWQPAAGDPLEVALGQDDRLHVDVESPGNFTQSRGVFGGSVERSSSAVYAIVNQRPEAVVVEMLDAAPVSRDEAIRVTHAWSPQPTATDWGKHPGLAEWTLAIPAQSTQRVSVGHTVVAPKDAVVANLP